MLFRSPMGLLYDLGVAVEQTRVENLVVDGDSTTASGSERLEPLKILEPHLGPQTKQVFYCMDQGHPRKPVYLLVPQGVKPRLVVLIARQPSPRRYVPVQGHESSAMLSFFSQHFPRMNGYRMERLTEEEEKPLCAEIARIAHAMESRPLRAIG